MRLHSSALPVDCSACSTACLLLERLDLDVHAGRQIELHQRVHRLLGRLEDVDQPLVGADLERLARLLVHVRRTQHAVLVLDRRQRNRTRHRCPGALGRFHDLAGRGIQHAIVVCLQPDSDSLSYHWLLFPVQFSSVQSVLSSADPRTDNWNCCTAYLMISVIVPAPTVLPPSRMAKRRPFSMATGVISSISSCTLSPGITISVPSGSSATPVTSVVRK